MSVLLGRRDENQNGNRGNRDSELERGGEKKGKRKSPSFPAGAGKDGACGGVATAGWQYPPNLLSFF